MSKRRRIRIWLLSSVKQWLALVDEKKNSIAVNTLSSYYRIMLERRDRAATIIETAKEKGDCVETIPAKKILCQKVLTRY